MPAANHPPIAFTLAYDVGTSRLLAHWAAPVADERLRAHYTHLLAEARAHGNCRFWLLDLRGRGWHTLPFGQWYSGVFAPAVHAALGQPVFMAYVLSPEHYALANQPGTQTMQRDCTAHSVYPFFFDNETAAREWLAHQQAFDVVR